MLASLRRFAATWPAKVFFVVLVGSFGLWGVAGLVQTGFGGTDPNSVATVGGMSISASELQDGARRMLAEYARQTGNATPPGADIRRAAADQALQQLLIQAAFSAEVDRLRLAVPDDALRQATFETKAFWGAGGRFDRSVFNTVLRNNGLTEQHYLALLRTDLGQRQLVEAVRAGGYGSDLVARLVYGYQGEARTAAMVSLPFAGAAEPPAPTDDDLQRAFDDDSTAYSLPEERRIKAVILSPESVAKDIAISDADARSYYASHPDAYGQAETRTVQIVVAGSEAAGKALATAWISGADWDAVQKQAAGADASALQLDDQTESGFPSADLAKPVFAAAEGIVTGPLSNEGEWPVFRVLKVTPGREKPFEAVAASIKSQLATEQATDQVYDRANKVQDALAGGAKLDELPGGLGLQAVTGTLDAAGKTPEGAPAPIPGSDALRDAVIKRAFAVAPGDPPTLEDGPEHSFYAVSVDAITPPQQLPLEAVRDQVREDWLRDQRRRAQNLVATGLLTAVAGGATLQAAAADAHVAVTQSPPISRGRASPGVPSQLVQPLFATEIGRPTMVETPTGFVVAVPLADTKPDPAANPAAVDQVRAQLTQSAGNDLEITYATALRGKAKVSVNSAVFDQVAR